MVQTTVATRQDRARDKADKRIANAMRHLPETVKARWVNKFGADAEIAFKALLTGSAHVCEKCGCNRPHVHAVRLYCEMADAVGPANQFIVNLTQSMGVADQAELQRLVMDGRRLETMARGSTSPEECRDAAVELLAPLMRAHPEWLPGVLARLGSGAEVVEEGVRLA